MKVKNLLIVFAIIGFSYPVFSQNQIRLRGGYARFYTSGKDVGLHTAGGKGAQIASGIGLEYFMPLSPKRDGKIFGAFFEVQEYRASVNYRKFPVSPRSFFVQRTYGSVKLYAGYEKVLTKNRRRNTNYFSFDGGVSLSVNPMGKGDKGVMVYGSKEMGRTLSGDMYGGVYVDDGWSTPGYFIVIATRTANFITPDVFAGLRWNIRNRQGIPVFVVECVTNYSLLPKAYIGISYTLNGEQKTDLIKDYGFNTQLNLVIPLKTFWKKRIE